MKRKIRNYCDAISLMCCLKDLMEGEELISKGREFQREETEETKELEWE